jgi:hypothetical protein
LQQVLAAITFSPAKTQNKYAMKLLFFLVALCLVMLQAYVAIGRHGKHSDDNDGTMTISSGDYYEQIKWSGKIELSEDENSIAHIPPGGYLKFRENDARMMAESNLKGEITYQLYDGQNNLALNDSGKHFISTSIKKMIARGFAAGGRAERINKKGGYRALVAELPNLQMENIKTPYLDLLFSNDTLKGNELSVVIRQMASAVNDADKENLLKRITPAQRKDSLVSKAYLDIVAGINPDIQKVNLLSRLIETDSLSTGVFTRIMGICAHFNADIDKQHVYYQLADRKDLTEDQFVQIIDAAGEQHADTDKSNLLIHLAQKMPRTEKTKAAYLTAAKKINNDADFGRAVKIIE